jgi:FkbM family methyltransferase
MIEFSSMSGAVSRVMRRALRAVPPGMRVRVVQGPLRGAKWIAGSSSAGCWLGSYETDVQALLTKLVPAGGVFYDVGANVGFFSLLASRLVGPSGRVYSFEPLPANLEYLRRHVALNRCENVAVMASAVSDRAGRATFGGEGSTAKLVEGGAFEVETVALDDLWASEALRAPDVIKLDVEGAELLALRGMRRMLDATHPYLLVEFHGQWVEGTDIDTECRKLLTELGYRLEKIGHEVCAVPPGAPEL